MTHAYPLDMVADEVYRLRIQGEMFRPDATRALGEIGGLTGARVLDLCCGVGGITDCLVEAVGPTGTVSGLDYDPAKLAAARDWNPAPNVTFVEGDAFQPDLSPAQFDLVHTRFAMGIIPNGAQIFDVALGLVKPGGVLFLQEGFPEPYTCHPPCPAFDRGKAVMFDCFVQIGSTLTMGLDLPALFDRAGLAEARFHPCTHIVRAGDPMADHMPLTLEAMRATILDLGLMSGDELTATIAEIRAHMAVPGHMMLSFTLVQAIARKA